MIKESRGEIKQNNKTKPWKNSVGDIGKQEIKCHHLVEVVPDRIATPDDLITVIKQQFPDFWTFQTERKGEGVPLASMEAEWAARQRHRTRLRDIS